MGEGNFDTLVKYVAATMKFYKEQDAIKNHPLPMNPTAELLTPNLDLKFPGKITCSKSNPNDDIPELYAISDSGNHRIVIISASGDVLHKIGGKQPGFVDGDLKSAKFNSPQGVSFLNENILFVADTENHAVRRIDLKEKSVTTIAGTGVQGNDRVGGKIGTEQEISSPWDIAGIDAVANYISHKRVIFRVVFLFQFTKHEIWICHFIWMTNQSQRKIL